MQEEKKPTPGEEARVNAAVWRALHTGQKGQEVVNVAISEQGRMLIGQTKIWEKIEAALSAKKITHESKVPYTFKEPRTLHFRATEAGELVDKGRENNVKKIIIALLAENGNRVMMNIEGATTVDDQEITLPPLTPATSSLESLRSGKAFQSAAEAAKRSVQSLERQLKVLKDEEEKKKLEENKIPPEQEAAMFQLLELLAKKEELDKKNGLGRFLTRILKRPPNEGEQPKQPSELLRMALSTSHDNQTLNQAALSFLAKLTDPEKSGGLGPEELVNMGRPLAEKLLGMYQKAEEQSAHTREVTMEEVLRKISLDPTPQNRTAIEAGMRKFLTMIGPASKQPPQHADTPEGKQKAEERTKALLGGIETVKNSGVFIRMSKNDRERHGAVLEESEGRISKRKTN
ncbi:hypothetical protein KKC44_04745 [Patescibacteria group bacterium]|nr:hypothetical protein [Patescibacteria group bacterium]MBU2259883.1 hypothetical protein [Patescibacteria group bacterium]